ncbi:stage II sporulation protein P [Pontibacillus salicampi]|uniref:Stage II sporulation protein P n=1 Tax=Pontibacillus salicampi TaxID=1449801 RepID=A0ABV6LJH2_9BACI
MKTKGISPIQKEMNKWYKRSSFYLLGIVMVFLLIGILTSIQPAYRLSSSTLHHWTSQVNGASFLRLMGMENRIFIEAYPDEQEEIKMSELVFQTVTSIKLTDPRTLLGREIPGFSVFDGEIIVAGEGTDYTNMPIESSPPMDVFDQEKEAVVKQEEEEESKEKQEPTQSTGDRNVVFIYHSHNRESFLPLLPKGTKPDEAYHSEANITLVGERLAKGLQNNGIGATVDKTDIPSILKEEGLNYYESYDASRPVVETAMKQDDNLQYYFDLHRDSLPKDITTTKIHGKSYARIFFVIGGKFAKHEENLKLANELHKRVEKMYPGLSRGVYTKKDAGSNGKYNQDLSPNAILIEFGGLENNLDELYRSADAVADVFSDFYWKAEKVNAN